MPVAIGGVLLLVAIIAFPFVWRVIVDAIFGAAEHGVDKAAIAHKRRRPTRMWLVPGQTSVSSLFEHVRANATAFGTDEVSVQMVARKGREVVECSIAAGADAETLRADILRAARKLDADCILLLT